MTITFRLATVAGTLALAACTTADLQSFNNGLAQMNRALAPNANGTPAFLGPSLSTEQQQQLRSAVSASLGARDAAFRNQVNSAQPVLVAVMSKASCYHEWNDSRVLSMYTSAQLGNGWIPSPWTNMKYAPKNRCLTVLRTDSWTQKSLNSFRFRAVYYSPESGESQALTYEFINQDGAWLLNAVL
ncbi:hypothetical protein [Paraburkholderia sp. SOS3]|jgi:hypothetical protein|uniref:hypothetical protein n=1 Tax=Paraburkholderia sp. SOS3 TaxID=1926494 RepID=UPI0009476E83|nr:hypothetical protein [Paraburkholderia sp. SOS3]APR37237.1 hypothetical protein BTO02_19590 [Paraburkholderia sp. SOS3]